MYKQPSLPPKHHPRQSGVALIFALLTLVALMLATLGLVRSVDTGTLLLGNIGFKQDATASADQATREAINWLDNNKASLNTDIAGEGYYASTQEFESNGVTAKLPLDVTWKQLEGSASRQLLDWDGDNCAAATSGSYTGCTVKAVRGEDVNGNKAHYVIFRLCSKPGDYGSDNTVSCVKPADNGKSNASGRGELNYAEPTRFSSTTGPYYRVVVRVLGARNTASFTETIVHF